MEITIRHLAAVLALASAVRAVVATALHGALAIASPGLAIDSLGERLFSYAVPVVAAAAAWLVAPPWASWIGAMVPALARLGPLSTRSASVIVGTAAVIGPLLWLASGWTLLVLRMAALRSWDDGRRFLAPDYYALIVITWGPWLLAGALLLALARHSSAQ